MEANPCLKSKPFVEPNSGKEKSRWREPECLAGRMAKHFVRGLSVRSPRRLKHQGQQVSISEVSALRATQGATAHSWHLPRRLRGFRRTPPSFGKSGYPRGGRALRRVLSANLPRAQQYRATHRS